MRTRKKQTCITWTICRKWSDKLYKTQTSYFKIIYLHIIGMKTGWYVCDGTDQFPHRNSLYRKYFQTWTKWINILVNKYISDMSLYWNVLLYIKYNTISFFCFCCSLFVQSIQNILTYPLRFWRDLKKAVSAHYCRKTRTKQTQKQHKDDGVEQEML